MNDTLEYTLICPVLNTGASGGRGLAGTGHILHRSRGTRTGAGGQEQEQEDTSRSM